MDYPIVLIHGFNDIPILSGSWKSVEILLDKMGINYFTPHIPPHGSIEERSASLIRQIACKYPRKTVHLFGHSMGGLNARDIAAKMMRSNLGFQVKTVTTFGTPNRGIKWNTAPGVDGTSGIASFIRQIFHTDLGAVGNMNYVFMKGFNARTTNNPSVKYFSWAGETAFPTPLFAPIFPYSRLWGPTDGLINVDSVMWGSDLGAGTHLGTVHGLDHLAIISRMTVVATLPHLVAAEHGKTAVVQPVDNNLSHALACHIEGGVNAAFAPARAVLGMFNLL